MKPHRSQTAGFFFPIPQLFRAGRKRAAFGWIATNFALGVLLFVGFGVAIGASGAAGMAIVLISILALGGCGIAQMVHAHRAVRAWNTSVDSANYEQWMAWQRAADLQRSSSYGQPG